MKISNAPPWKERLRQERIRRNWRQQDLADQLGTTVLTIQRWERGSHQPSAYFRVKLCALFGTSAQELGFVPNEPSPSSSEESAAGLAPETAGTSQERAPALERPADVLLLSAGPAPESLLGAPTTLPALSSSQARTEFQRAQPTPAAMSQQNRHRSVMVPILVLMITVSVLMFGLFMKNPLSGPKTYAVEIWWVRSSLPIYAPSGNCERHPSRSCSIIDHFSQKDALALCQTEGEFISIPDGSSNWWMKIKGDHGKWGWISNVYIKGPAKIPSIPDC